MRKAICFLIIYSAAPESVALKLYHCYCSCLERGGCSDGPDPSCLSPPTYFSSLQYWWAAGPSRLQQRLKAPSWTPDRCVGSVILVEPAGRRGPQKEIKGRNTFENKYEAETRLKSWRSSTDGAGVHLCLCSAPTDLWPSSPWSLYVYYTHTHTHAQRINFCSTRPPLAALHHCAPQCNKPCLKCINLLTTMVMCTLRGIPALLTSCSWNIVFILTVNWTRIKYTARKHETVCQVCWYLIANEHRRQEEKSISEPWMKLWSGGFF